MFFSLSKEMSKLNFKLNLCRFEYYGNRFWNILDHTCVPLMMFYRFHASVCLVDIWNHAFKPIEHHQ